MRCRKDLQSREKDKGKVLEIYTTVRGKRLERSCAVFLTFSADHLQQIRLRACEAVQRDWTGHARPAFDTAANGRPSVT